MSDGNGRLRCIDVELRHGGGLSRRTLSVPYSRWHPALIHHATGATAANTGSIRCGLQENFRRFTMANRREVSPIPAKKMIGMIDSAKIKATRSRRIVRQSRPGHWRDMTFFTRLEFALQFTQVVNS